MVKEIYLVDILSQAPGRSSVPGVLARMWLGTALLSTTWQGARHFSGVTVWARGSAIAFQLHFATELASNGVLTSWLFFTTPFGTWMLRYAFHGNTRHIKREIYVIRKIVTCRWVSWQCMSDFSRPLSLFNELTRAATGLSSDVCITGPDYSTWPSSWVASNATSSALNIFTPVRFEQVYYRNGN